MSGDIFISYARKDNATSDHPDSRGMVEALHNRLLEKFGEAGPPEPTIFRDTQQFGPMDQFERRLGAALMQAQLLLVILSRNWLDREWCLRELATFVANRRADGLSEQNIKERICVVRKHNVPREVPREDRPNWLQGQTGFDLLKIDPENGDELEFWDSDLGCHQDKQWYPVTEKIAKALRKKASGLNRPDRAVGSTVLEVSAHSQSVISPEKSLSPREQIWADYSDWLARDVQATPIFLQKPGGLTLSDIYVPLRCYWREKPHYKNQEQICHVIDLNQHLKAWTESDDKSDLIRVVTGGPGSGKSSSAKILARDLAQQGAVNCYMISLQGLELDHAIEKIVAGFMKKKALTSAWKESPLDHWDNDDKPLLLIFDGLDEIAPPGDRLSRVTGEFVRRLNVWLADQNDQSVLPVVKSLALGRPEAAKTAATEADLKDHQLLQVLPLNPKTHPDFADRKVSDTALFKGDQRPYFWAKSNSGSAARVPPQFEGQFEEFTQEPLLFYLLIVSGYLSEAGEEEQNTNLIYRSIFKKIHQRDVDKHSKLSEQLGSTPEEKSANFDYLIECLGLAAWRSGGRITSEEAFDQIRDHIHAKPTGVDFSTITAATLRNAVLQFFTGPSDAGHGEFTFVHKSFSDYLTARALIRAASSWIDQNANLETFAYNWLRLTGAEPATAAILEFMKNEAQLVANASSDESSTDHADKMISQLTGLFSDILSSGFPAQTDAAQGSWRDRERHQRNAEEALIVTINAWAEIAFPWKSFDLEGKKGGWQPGSVKITWPSKDAAGLLFHRLVGQRTEFNHRTIASCAGWDLSDLSLINADMSLLDLRWAKLQDADLQGVNLHVANLYVADLRYADLHGADLRDANLRAANLLRANLRAANLQDANLQDADLRGAYLQKADLLGANLRRANLLGAYLRGANLQKADLQDADLQDANLRGADLRRADLLGAYLRGAKLHGADLQDADLQKANLQGADLQGAALDGAVDLTQKQVNSARGNRQTKLPRGIRRPDHWEVD